MSRSASRVTSPWTNRTPGQERVRMPTYPGLRQAPPAGDRAHPRAADQVPTCRQGRRPHGKPNSSLVESYLLAPQVRSAPAFSLLGGGLMFATGAHYCVVMIAEVIVTAMIAVLFTFS